LWIPRERALPGLLRTAKPELSIWLKTGTFYLALTALKACICARTNQFDFYVHPRVASKAWSHEFGKLIEVSGLEEEFRAARQSDRVLDVNWKTVEDWSEDSRYEPRGQREAEDLLVAVSDPDHGVLSCIKRYW